MNATIKVIETITYLDGTKDVKIDYLESSSFALLVLKERVKRYLTDFNVNRVFFSKSVASIYLDTCYISIQLMEL